VTNKGVILGFLCRLYAAFTTWYRHSGLCKLTEVLKRFLVRITRHSFFVNFFSASSRLCEAVSGSLLGRALSRLFGALGALGKRVGEYARGSIITHAFLWFYRNLFHIPVRCFGITGAGAIVVYAALCLATGALTATMACILVVALVLCVVAILINRSLYALCSGSGLCSAILYLFGLDTKEERPAVTPIPTAHLVCLLVGMMLGAAAFAVNPFLIALAVCGILGAGAIIYNFRIGVYLAVAFLPFLPTMVLVGLMMLSLLSMVARLLLDGHTRFVRTALDFPLLVFAGILVISALTSFAVASSVKAVAVYLAFIASYFLITNTITTKKRLYALVAAALFAALGVALYGIYQHVFGFAEGDTWIDKDMFSDIQTRVVSTFENPNVLGEYLLLLIPIGMAFIWAAPKAGNRLIALAITGALALCMVYTYSRGNWIGLLVAMFLYFAFYDRRFIWLGVIALLFSPMLLPQSIIERFLSVGDVSDTSTSYRVYIWMGTFSLLKDYWLSGIGIGSDAFNMIYPFYSYSSIVAPHSHNLFLQITVENGILGIISFGSIVVVYFKTIISSLLKTHDRFLKALLTGLGAGMAGYLVQGMFDNVWYNYRIFLLFFVILGIGACSAHITGEMEENA